MVNGEIDSFGEILKRSDDAQRVLEECNLDLVDTRMEVEEWIWSTDGEESRKEREEEHMSRGNERERDEGKSGT